MNEFTRPEIWKIICNVKSNKLKDYGPCNYNQLIRRQLPAEVNDQIMKDLERTVIDNCDFQVSRCAAGSNKLFNVLRAYANLD